MITYEKLAEENAQLRGLLASNDTAKHEVVKENKELRSVLEDSLKSFMLTQDTKIYGGNHWSNRAIRLLHQTSHAATGKEGEK